MKIRRVVRRSGRVRVRTLVSRNFTVFAVIVAALWMSAGARAQSGPLVGKLNIVRDVLVSREAVTTGTVAQYVLSKQGQGVFNGQGVRTLKRSQAEVVFNDRSALRVNERTDLIVRDEATLRRIQLQAGTVWVRVARGVNTQVETPAATAVARGTVFTVTRNEDGSTTLTVYKDTVELQIPGRADPLLVKEGQTITVSASSGVPAAPTTLAKREIPVEYGGTLTGWWETVADNPGLAVTAGTEAVYALRTSQSGETGQALQTVSQLGKPSGSSFFIPNLTERQQFLSAAQQSLLSDFKGSGLTLSAYQSQFGNQSVFNRFEFNSATTAQLNQIGVKTVSDYINATKINGAALNITIDSSRYYYRPSSVTGEPNYDFRLLDRTESSGWFVGVGAAAALLASYSQDKTLTFLTPAYEFSASAYAADPYVLAGARANVKGRVSATRYEFEANLLSILYGDPKNTSGKLLSVAVVDQQIAPGIRVYAGRRRFYHGPTFLNQNLSQLIAERYDGAGVILKQGPLSFDGGYVYDANPDVKGAQQGAVASAFYQQGDGQFGLHYLRASGLRDGNGVTVSGAYRLLPRVLEAYGEFGRGPDKATLYTIGAHLPGVYETTDIDVFVEYGFHQGISNSLTVAALKDAGKNASFRLFVDFAGPTRGVTAGLAGLYRWGR